MEVYFPLLRSFSIISSKKFKDFSSAIANKDKGLLLLKYKLRRYKSNPERKVKLIQLYKANNILMQLLINLFYLQLKCYLQHAIKFSIPVEFINNQFHGNFISCIVCELQYTNYKYERRKNYNSAKRYSQFWNRLFLVHRSYFSKAEWRCKSGKRLCRWFGSQPNL